MRCKAALLLVMDAMFGSAEWPLEALEEGMKRA